MASTRTLSTPKAAAKPKGTPAPDAPKFVIEESVGSSGIDQGDVAMIAALLAENVKQGVGVRTGAPHTHNLPHDYLTAIRATMGDAAQVIEDGRLVLVLGTAKVEADPDTDQGETFRVYWRKPTQFALRDFAKAQAVAS